MRFVNCGDFKFCPSLQDKLAKRICGLCGLYFTAVNALNSHRRLHKIPMTTTVAVAEEVVIKKCNNNIYIIEDFKNWLNNE